MKTNLRKLLLSAALVPISFSLHAATDTWIGGNGDWSVATNWSTGAVPGLADSVVIGAGPAITITHSSNFDTVLSIQSQQTLNITGGTVEVTAGTSSFTGAFSVTNAAELAASGAGTIVTCGGPATLDGGNLAATGGAVMNFPTVHSFNPACGGGNWIATGSNSVLYFPALTNIFSDVCTYSTIQAEYGGLVTLSNVESIVTGAETFQADSAGSILDLRRLTNCAGQQGYFVNFEASAGGAVYVTNLAAANTVALNFNGLSATFPGLTNFTDGNLNLSSGSVVTLPALKNYSKTCYGAVWTLTGAGTVASFPALTNISGQACSYPTIEVESGAQLLMSNVGVILAGPLGIQADGSGSVVNLSGLTNATGQEGYYVEFEASAGGSMLIPKLANAPGVDLNFSGGAITLANLTNFLDGNISLSGGAVLTLPGLSAYAKLCSGANWLVTGAGTVLNFPAMTNLGGEVCNYPNIQAEAGGQILLTNVNTMLVAPLTFDADGTGSLIDLSNLTNSAGTNGYVITFEASAGGTIKIPKVINGPGIVLQYNALGTITASQMQTVGGLSVNGAAVNFPALTNFYDDNITVSGGGTLTLSALRQYTKNCNGGSWTVTGVNSILNFPLLTNMTEQPCNFPTIEAEAGGQILFTNLQSIFAGPQGFNADGTGSLIDMRALTNCSGQTSYDVTFEASAGGEMVLTNLPQAYMVGVTINAGGLIPLTKLAALSNGSLTISGSTNSFPALKNIDGSSLTASAGGLLTMGGIGSYQAGYYQEPVWQATGAGSQVSLPALTNVSGDGNPSVPFLMEATADGTLSLPALQTIANGCVGLLADGAGSVVNLTALSGFVLENGQGSLTAQNGGVLQLNNQAFLIANVAINIPAGNPVLPPTVTAASALTLYGQAWHSYVVEERNTSIPNSPFTIVARIPMTNSLQQVLSKTPANTAFVVAEFVANPPIMDILRNGSQVQPVLYGLTNGSYEVLSSTNLSSAAAWTNNTSVTMTNAFRILPPVTPAPSRPMFYEAKEL